MVLGDLEHALDVGADRHRFGAAVEHAAAWRDHLWVVIGPARTGQIEELFPFGKTRRGIRIGIDKDMQVVEGGEQASMARLQHAVPKHVARHVADPDHREVAVLDIAPQLAEMAFDQFPRATRGDPHRLVVVTRGAAGGESVAEPEAVFFRYPVRDIGERRGALVGGDDEVRIVGVMAHGLGRRHDCVTSAAIVGALGKDIVGNVEQAADQDLVTLDPLSHQLIARGGRPLQHEAAFRADRHDDRVLDRLRFHQPENLGAEILLAV